MSTMIILSMTKKDGPGPVAARSEQMEGGDSDFHKLVELEEGHEAEPEVSAPQKDPGSGREQEEQSLNLPGESRSDPVETKVALLDAAPTLDAADPPDAKVAEANPAMQLLVSSESHTPITSSSETSETSAAGHEKNAQLTRNVLAQYGPGAYSQQAEQGKVPNFDAVSEAHRTLPPGQAVRAQTGSAPVEAGLLLHGHPIAVDQSRNTQGDGRHISKAAAALDPSGGAPRSENAPLPALPLMDSRAATPPAQFAQTMSLNATAQQNGVRAPFDDADWRIGSRLVMQADGSNGLPDQGALSQFPAADRLQVTALAARPEVARSVAQQMSATILAQPGTNAIGIQLDPVELGRVSMVLRTVEDGLSLSISTERLETMELMRRHVSELTEEFRALGYENVSFDFGTEREGKDNGPSHENRARPGIGAGPVEIQPEVRAGLNLSQTGIDMRL